MDREFNSAVTTANVLNAYLRSKFSGNLDSSQEGTGLIGDDERVYEKIKDGD